MVRTNLVKKNSYYDSVTLMLLSSKLSSIQGVHKAAVMMGTEMNKSLLKDSGLLEGKGFNATANDMIIAVTAAGPDVVEAVCSEVEDFLHNKQQSSEEEVEIVNDLDTALTIMPGANLAAISVPGQYAKYEAMKALKKGLHVFLFSDNVSLEEEIELKKYATENGLLMMGPDCGTAIINNRAIGFANNVKPGNIGIIAAAGTGLQEVACLISQNGKGISQALGTGGRDLKDSVGGAMMLQCLRALDRDPETEVIVLISKPPSPTVTERIFSLAEKVSKPVVVCFLGQKIKESKNILPAGNLEEAAFRAVKIAGGDADMSSLKNLDSASIDNHARAMDGSQRFLRGVFSGGTLCYEALLIAGQTLGEVYSNVPLDPAFKLLDSYQSNQHTCVDLGEDEFTRGRPHPMIEPSLRAERILQEAHDPETAVILLDLVLGYGSHLDPAGALVPAVTEAKKTAEKEGRSLSIVASVCGTDLDPQNREQQINMLTDAGVLVMPSNASAARLACEIVRRKTRGSE